MSKFGEPQLSPDEIANYQKVLGIFQQILAGSDLAKLESLSLQLTDIVEQKRISLPDDDVGQFVLQVVGKAISEAWALIGSLRNGAYTSCFHHARAVIELYAALTYVFSKRKKRSKRAKKFIKYHSVYALNHYTSLNDAVDRGEITQEVFDDQCVVPDDLFEVLSHEVPELAKLYGVDEDELHKIQNWHYPARISNLLEIAYNRAKSQSERQGDGPIEKGVDLDNLSKIYGQFCEMTHLSPLSAQVSGPFLMFGYPKVEPGEIDYDALNRPISITLMMLTDIVLLLEEEIRINIDVTLPGI